jgi:hypothetical protein
MSVVLGKEFVLTLYCYTLQGERSIAFSLGAPWSELRAFYSGERTAGLKRFVRCVDEKLNEFELQSPAPGRDELARFARSPGLFQHLIGRWVSRWKRRWTFPGPVFGFMASALHSLVNVLEAPTRPRLEDLITLRMDLCTSRSFVEDLCYGLAALRLARRIEHFWQADWIIPVRLADVLGSGKREMVPVSRKTA